MSNSNIEISLRDLMKAILKQWRVLLIGMLLCAIIVTLVGGFTSQQKADEAEKALAEQIANGGPKEGEEELVVPEVVFVSVNNIVVGFVVGFMLVAGCVTIGYAMTLKLRCASDMSKGFSVSVIGTIKLERKKKWFGFMDRAIDSLFREEKKISAETNIKIISTDIALAMKKKGIQAICFTGNTERETIQPIIQALRTADKEKALKIDFEKLAIYSPKALEKMLNAESIVLFERIGKSKFADIDKELEYCKRYDIPVLGCVVIE